MRLITQLLKSREFLTNVGRANLELLASPQTLRIVVSEEFGLLTRALQPALLLTNGQKIKPGLRVSELLDISSPEYKHDWKAAWVEVDKPAEACWLVMADRTIAERIYVIYQRDRNGLLVEYRSDDPLFKTGGPQNQPFFEHFVFALQEFYGIVRAMNTLPDEFIREIRQPLSLLGEPGNGPKRNLPELTTIYLRAGRREGDGTISATDRRGQRWHQVRGHFWTPHTKTERQWRRTHWRGDPSLGVTTPIYKA